MGRVLAIDASLSLYQFMIAIRDGEAFGNLTNEAGDVTSHISGFLARVVKLLENGIKPVRRCITTMNILISMNSY